MRKIIRNGIRGIATRCNPSLFIFVQGTKLSVLLFVYFDKINELERKLLYDAIKSALFLCIRIAN
jgi:hypothetical protein